MALIELGVKHTASLVDSVMAPGPLKDMVIDGVIGGVGSVIVFLPNILILFAGVSFMEDTGYMARAAFIMDRIMHALGIHGKSFISLVMGFGCNVPAIMVTRSLENHQDRLLTILINPFMSCSARLPVYILFAGIFFREHAGAVILSLYMAGILLAFLSARLFKLLLFRGATTPFVMELPPYRMPTLKMTLLHMWDRSSQYIRKMGGIILACSILIWAAGEYPKSPAVQREYAARLARLEAAHAGKAGAEYEGLKERLLLEKAAREKEHTVIGRAGSAIHPLLEPLGLNWQMGVSLVAGFVAKEIVVSTMGVLYHAPPGHEGPHRVRHSLMETLQKPEHGITPLAAYTFMLFVLLYVPCLATIVVIGREAGWGWALFSIAYQLVFAWLVCFLFYNTGRLIGL
jgi:ferrous iron transport protein B